MCAELDAEARLHIGAKRRVLQGRGISIRDVTETGISVAVGERTGKKDAPPQAQSYISKVN